MIPWLKSGSPWRTRKAAVLGGVRIRAPRGETAIETVIVVSAAAGIVNGTEKRRSGFCDEERLRDR
jgi:hypothetical protein